MKEQEVAARIGELYPDAAIDVAGADCSFEVYVISDEFEGVSLLKRQQSILALFADDITSGKLHALTVKAKTPAEMQSGSGLVRIEL